MKILIVDDEVLVRKSLERAFRSRGHQVLTAENGTEGLTLWQKDQPDVILLDVLMPGLTGPQVISSASKEMLSATWVAFMSAFSGTQKDLTSGLPAEVDLFLPKPFEDIFSVVDRIEKLIQN